MSPAEKTHATPQAASAAVASVPAAQPTANASLIVGTTTYPIAVTTGETVVDAMRSLASTTPAFTFTGRDYSSLGFFVDSINGKGSAGGEYWMLYKNGVSAQLGVSSAVVSPGDTIEWRYEKGY